MVKELAEAEEKLADLVWENEPIKSSDLIKLCLEKFGWKKSTSYTLLKRAEKKKVLENKNSFIRSLLSKEAYRAEISKSFIDINFSGSLLGLISCFSNHNNLSDNEIKELENLIEKYKEEKSNG